MYIACEHMLQVGSYHLLQALNDSESEKSSKEHLVRMHLLGKTVGED